jgi:hypothetical protein
MGRRLLVVVLAGLLALPATALATHEVPQSADSIHVSLVPAFRQCGTGPNPANGQHSPPLGVASCLPPIPMDNGAPMNARARMGPDSTGSADLTVLPGDLQYQATLTDIRNTSGQDFNPSSGADLYMVVRFRQTDHDNCASLGCSGPFILPGTGRDHEFQTNSFGINCVPNGDPNLPPGSTCNINTTANAVFGTPSFTSGKATILQAFRVRITDFTGVQASFHSGIYIP